MNRDAMSRGAALKRILARDRPWDMIVIGGGATGVGVALDAAARDFDVLLLEQSDFGKGTSSRSTKLVHGGVRYLRQGNITLVRDALRERSLLRENAPHLVHDMAFLIPCQNLWQRLFYTVGLKIYDFLAFGKSFGRSHGVSRQESLRLVPTLSPDRLRGGVIYHDGQFDDARLLIHMVRTAHDCGACLANYMAVTDLVKNDQGDIVGVHVTDVESNHAYRLDARSVINAAGPFCDAVRSMDDPASEPMIAPSQGVHVVLPREMYPEKTAMIVPKTSDGRVVFIIPWHDHAIVGTTDTPIPEATLEPFARSDEIDFLLETSARYLAVTPTRDDILSVFTGIRPLVKGDKSARTASLSRDHVIRISPSKLITITGGKWTTVRKMAEDCVDRAIDAAGLDPRSCRTTNLKIHGACETTTPDHRRSFYGTDLIEIEQLEKDSTELSGMLSETLSIRRSDIVWAVRHEMARTVEDVLSRRRRALLLDVREALRIAPEVASLMAAELGKDEAWRKSQLDDFQSVARHYTP